ncbi:MAG TPA: hypothetical protein VLX92_00445 [Kofleriaceae bacterium]|nr:hypothetical protein [Kofleriaceae bacterium]
MADPFRDPEYICPSCHAPLRGYLARLVCDACGGMQLTEADFRRALEELAITPLELRWHGGARGRRCPQCQVRMDHGGLEVALPDTVVRPDVAIARCLVHGPWFPGGQLAGVFTALERRLHKGQPADGLPRRRWLSDD